MQFFSNLNLFFVLSFFIFQMIEKHLFYFFCLFCTSTCSKLCSHIEHNPISEFIDTCVNTWPAFHAAWRGSERDNTSEEIKWPQSIGHICHQWTAWVTTTRIKTLDTTGTQLFRSNCHALWAINTVALIKWNAVNCYFELDITVRSWNREKTSTKMNCIFMEIPIEKSYNLPVSVFPQPATSNG